MRNFTPFILSLICLLGVSAQAHDKASDDLRFPEGFKWCVATSAHQIEGDNTASDWWVFEHQPGHIKNHEVSGRAADHWNRVSEDIALMKSINVSDYRMSIEWAKIEPEEGKIDPVAVQHYVDELAQLQAHGIRPLVTLHHFTFPQWLAAKGGWEWSGAPAAFEKYTRLVYSFAGPYVTDWFTINEPLVMTLNGYMQGKFAPGEKRSIDKIVPVVVGLLKAHARAYHALHSLSRAAGRPTRVGMAHSVSGFVPSNKLSLIDIVIAKVADAGWNWALPTALQTGRLKFGILWFLNIDKKIPGLAGTQDFLGLNYYTTNAMKFSFAHGVSLMHQKGLLRSDLDWDIYPQGLATLLREAHRRYPHLPILISENGIADRDDALRPKYLVDHLRVVHAAIEKGIPVEGYCHWSLLDNFEWADGFTPRFGLFSVDYSTFKRTPTQSAALFAKIAGHNSLPAQAP